MTVEFWTMGGGQPTPDSPRLEMVVTQAIQAEKTRL
jgi:hypothetical protein